VLLRHVVPNMLQTVLLQCVIVFPLALQIFAALGFLSLGVPPPTPDWGASLQESRNYLTAAPGSRSFRGLHFSGPRCRRCCSDEVCRRERDAQCDHCQVAWREVVRLPSPTSPCVEQLSPIHRGARRRR